MLFFGTKFIFLGIFIILQIIERMTSAPPPIEIKRESLKDEQLLTPKNPYLQYWNMNRDFSCSRPALSLVILANFTIIAIM